jgi:hypothetical protein
MKIIVLAIIIVFCNNLPAGLEEPILKSDLELFTLMIRESDISDLLNPKFVDTAQEVVVYRRSQIELDEFKPYVPLHYVLAATASFFGLLWSAANRIEVHDRYFYPAFDKRMLEGGIILGALGSFWFMKKVLAERSANSQELYKNYLNAIMIKQTLIDFQQFSSAAGSVSK